MKSIVTTLFGSAALILTAIACDTHHHHEGAHVHGEGKLEVASDGNHATIILRAPGESIYGFEHVATSDEDITARDSGLAKLQENAGDHLKFSIACEITDARAQVTREHGDHEGHSDEHGDHDDHQEDGHSEVEVTYEFDCEEPVTGAELDIDYTQDFSGLKILHVTIVTERVQDSVVVEGADSVSL